MNFTRYIGVPVDISHSAVDMLTQNALFLGAGWLGGRIIHHLSRHNIINEKIIENNNLLDSKSVVALAFTFVTINKIVQEFFSFICDKADLDYKDYSFTGKLIGFGLSAFISSKIISNIPSSLNFKNFNTTQTTILMSTALSVYVAAKFVLNSYNFPDSDVLV